MERQKKKDYEPPALTAVTFKMERGFAGSGPLASVFNLGSSYQNNGDNAWDGSNTTGGNRFGGGWYDNGESAWGN